MFVHLHSFTSWFCFKSKVFHGKASSNFRFTPDLNYTLGNGNPSFYNERHTRKKSFNEETNLVENGSAVHSQKVKVFSDGESLLIL